MNNDDMYTTQEQIAAQKAIDVYNKFWNVKERQDFGAGKTYRNPATFDTELNKEVGDVWQLPNTKWAEKREDGSISITPRHPSFHKELDSTLFEFKKKQQTCPKCGKHTKNPNEIKVMAREKMCYTCIVEEELNDVIEGKELHFGFKPKEKPENDIIIKNSEGKVLMSLAEFRQEYGNEAADKLKNSGVVELPKEEEKSETYSQREIQKMAMRIQAEQNT
jgi:hypothetical protein